MPLGSFLHHPVVQAPMAGGASRPELAAAVCEAGGLGFLAGGYKSAEAVQEEVRALRALTPHPFGVNLFLPQNPSADPAAVALYGEHLAGEAAWYSTPLGDPNRGGDDEFHAKLTLLVRDPVPMVSFTFGCPTREMLDALREVGTVTAVTVTTPAEAVAAEAAGADVLCVQGAEAGGHQGTHRDDPGQDRAALGLLALLPQVREAVDLPLVAAGGIVRGCQIAAVMAAGADAAQLGTAFLPCPESGAHRLHKKALTDPSFTHTEPTRAFSGRPARGLVNRFMREHGPYAPAAYPQVHHLTAGLRRAAAAAGDAQGMALWAGQGHRLVREMPAGDLVRLLVDELHEAWTHPYGTGAREQEGPSGTTPGTTTPGTTTPVTTTPGAAATAAPTDGALG
ncbi:nitronate monooxygenase [Streptomyces thermolineatus]|uniref:Propionate 3-nitronate monooxygenase n=1 Tax=Streptomyces thermolineatus TaxID=44033 RepID=A0ABN3KUZ6_9ACTN